jgi:hypothetical protein
VGREKKAIAFARLTSLFRFVGLFFNQQDSSSRKVSVVLSLIKKFPFATDL